MNRVYDKVVIDDLARHLSLAAPLARRSAEEILAIIREGLLRDGVVNVTNLGSFRLKPVAARTGFNPRTRERIVIPAHQRVVFSPAKALRDQAEPQRQPPVPIVPEESAALALALGVPVAVISDAADEPRPPAVTVNRDEGSIAAPENRLDSEPFPPSEADPSPRSVQAPIVEKLPAGPVATTLVAHEHGMVVVPASAHPVGADDTGSEKPRTMAAEKTARSSTRRNYFLGVAVVLLLGSYIAFRLNSAPAALSAEPASAAVNQPASPPVSQAANVYFKEQTVKIAPGDSLWRLAEKNYQEAILWPHIYQANASTIDNPDYLVEGETIIVPSLEGPPDHLSDADRRSIARGYYLAYLFYKTTGRSDAPFALMMARLYDAKVVDNVALRAGNTGPAE